LQSLTVQSNLEVGWESIFKRQVQVMATSAADKTKTGESQQLVPPDEVFWQRYSPHHECLFSWLSSFTLHALVVGLMILIGIAVAMGRHSDQRRPPSMDVVQLEGGQGDGLEDGESGPAGAGQANALKSEAVENPSPETKTPVEPAAKLTELPKTQFEIPPVPDINTSDASADSAFEESLQKIKEDADQQVKKAMKIQAPPRTASTAGSGAKTGVGTGQGGPGQGVGRGKKGTGPGAGGGGGRAATRAEILAHRWRFDLTGTPREHADKIDTVGFILAIPSARGDFLVVRDLKRRPVQAKAENLAPYKDAIKWYNTTAPSVQGLARELGLGFQPRFVVLLLPKDREEKMAEAEARYAQSQGRSLNTIRATWFDFRLQSGTFEPIVIRQE
jgi:hypothetical protein